MISLLSVAKVFGSTVIAGSAVALPLAMMNVAFSVKEQKESEKFDIYGGELSETYLDPAPLF